MTVSCDFVHKHWPFLMPDCCLGPEILCMCHQFIITVQEDSLPQSPTQKDSFPQSPTQKEPLPQSPTQKDSFLPQSPTQKDPLSQSPTHRNTTPEKDPGTIKLGAAARKMSGDIGKSSGQPPVSPVHMHRSRKYLMMRHNFHCFGVLCIYYSYVFFLSQPLLGAGFISGVCLRQQYISRQWVKNF